MAVKVRIPEIIRKKYKIPEAFKNRKEEAEFWLEMDGGVKTKISFEWTMERYREKHGKYPKFQRVIKVRKRSPKQIK